MFYTSKIDRMYEYNMRFDCKIYFLVFIIFYNFINIKLRFFMILINKIYFTLILTITR